MNHRTFLAIAVWAGLWGALDGTAGEARAAEADDWIATWTASPQPVWEADFLVPLGVPRNLWSQTVRQVASVSVGGRRARVVLSNEYGDRGLRRLDHRWRHVHHRCQPALARRAGAPAGRGGRASGGGPQ